MNDREYPPQIWARRHPNGVVGARDQAAPYSPISNGDHYAEYTRSDLGSFYKDSDIDRLTAERDSAKRSLERARHDVTTWQEMHDEARAEVERLREALEFYANSAAYDWHPEYDASPVEHDAGQTARAVLKCDE